MEKEWQEHPDWKKENDSRNAYNLNFRDEPDLPLSKSPEPYRRHLDVIVKSPNKLKEVRKKLDAFANKGRPPTPHSPFPSIKERFRRSRLFLQWNWRKSDAESRVASPVQTTQSLRPFLVRARSKSVSIGQSSHQFLDETIKFTWPTEEREIRQAIDQIEDQHANQHTNQRAIRSNNPIIDLISDNEEDEPLQPQTLPVSATSNRDEDGNRNNDERSSISVSQPARAETMQHWRGHNAIQGDPQKEDLITNYESVRRENHNPKVFEEEIWSDSDDEADPKLIQDSDLESESEAGLNQEEEEEEEE
ncbi:hypothetical protein BOTCAL_0275g00100 [Botryotinia calthae]|uniref:Uncharacterized protein n=1 Tax=Botryotinia calthae TaxID=38488 RepID=A0A4Y8CY51_9HELO|nr:hypothetical protein BOTCAL_0275g00100 [Botryotinia calthae]